MNENLINDFLERSNNVKDIDEDAIKDSTVQILIPSSGVAKVDMSSLWTYDNATRQDIVNEYFTNVNIINHMILDLCNGPVENKNEVVANIMEAITDHAEQLELHTNWPNLSPDAEAIMICLDVKAFLEACIQFIADTFDIIPEKENIIMDPETENPFNEGETSDEPTAIDDNFMQEVFNQNSIEGLFAVAAKYSAKDKESDDEANSDEYFANMLAAELVGATEGEEFTETELYGDKDGLTDSE